jgi:AcrR family transcriptional regulator
MNSPPDAQLSASTRNPAGAPKKARTDGAQARERLLHIALRLFAERGYAKTSTRAIAQTAEVNLAAIRYYFGDKAGLYRAAYTEPLGNPCTNIALYQPAHFTLRESLQGFFAGFIEPMKQEELVQLCMRLHFREMLEPTGLWAEEIDSDIKPAHEALVAVLRRHLGVKKIDDDMHRLAFSIAGLALQLFICRDVIDAIRPQLIATPSAVNEWASRLADYAVAMVAVEAARREASRSVVPDIARKKKS